MYLLSFVLLQFNSQQWSLCLKTLFYVLLDYSHNVLWSSFILKLILDNCYLEKVWKRKSAHYHPGNETVLWADWPDILSTAVMTSLCHLRTECKHYQSVFSPHVCPFLVAMDFGSVLVDDDNALLN